MHLISSLLFALSANIDSFIVGMSYGIKKSDISLLKSTIISLVTLVGTIAAILMGTEISQLLPASCTVGIGCALLIGLGLYYQFEAMDLGNIAHQSMERFAKKADANQIPWTEMGEAMRTQLIEESVEESIVDYGNTVLFSSARNEYMVTRIKKLIHRSVWALTEQLRKGDFVPSGYEMKFGSGKIDRIDVTTVRSRAS